MEKSTNKPEHKFKVGENVMVNTASKHFGWQSEMQEHVGKQGVISKFYCGDTKIKGEYGYWIGDYVWPESALEKLEKTYTLEQIKEAFDVLQWLRVSFELLSDKLKETQDPEYKLYLELKAKFEGKE